MIQSMPVVSTLTINMNRNANPPVFTRNPYTVQMEWRDVPGKSLVNISASDADGVSVIFWNVFLFSFVLI